MKSEIASKLNTLLGALKEKIILIDELSQNKNTVSPEQNIIIQNKETDKTDSPEIVALMLEAKSHSNSRANRAKEGDNYQPFLISNEEEFNRLREVISIKRNKNEPFKFDFLYFDDNHYTPIQIHSDGKETNLFSIDAYGMDKSQKFRELVGDSNIYYYAQGEIQIGVGCNIFAIQNLNSLNNMTTLEKKTSLVQKNLDPNNPKIYSELNPKFLKTTQRLGKIEPQQQTGLVNKTHKPTKTLQDSLDKSSIIIPTDNGNSKKQNRLVTQKLNKYLLSAQTELNNAKNIESLIDKRMHFDENIHNTYKKEERIPKTVAEAQTAILKYQKQGKGFDIGEVIRTVPEENRVELKQSALEAIEKLREQNDFNFTAQMRDIIEAFPEKDKSYFNEIRHQIISELVTKADYKSIADVIQSASCKDRKFFEVEAQEVINTKLNRDNLNQMIEIIQSFPQGRNNAMANASIIALAKRGYGQGIIRIINSFPEAERDDLSEVAITSFIDNSKKPGLFIKSFPENKRTNLIKTAVKALAKRNDSQAIDDLFKEFPQNKIKILEEVIAEHVNQDHILVSKLPLNNVLRENFNYNVENTQSTLHPSVTPIVLKPRIRAK